MTYISTLLPSSLHKAIAAHELKDSSKLFRDIFDNVHHEIERTDGFLRKVYRNLDAFRFLLSVCDLFYNDPFIKNLIDNKKTFDLIIFLGVFDTCSLELSHHLNMTANIMHFPSTMLLPNQLYQLNIPISPASFSWSCISVGRGHEIRLSPVKRLKNVIYNFPIIF